MAIQKKQIKEFLLQALPNMKQVSGGTEIAGPCPFCGETRPKFYIGHFSDTDENPIRYNCFICKSSGMVDQAFLDKCNVQAAMDPEVLKSNKGPGYVTRGLTQDTIYNLRYDFISDTEISRAKLGYINNRLGLKLDYQDCIDNKIVLNLSDLLTCNNITYYTKPDVSIQQLDKYFIGFLTRSCSSINMRNLAVKNQQVLDTFHESMKGKYHNYRIFKASPDNDFYVLPTKIDLTKLVRVFIAEGPFDVLGIKYNLIKSMDNCVYIAGKGKAYDAAMYWIITNLASPTVEIHLFPDKDVSNTDIRTIIGQYAFLPYTFFVHNNTYSNEKDYGVPEWRISDFKWQEKSYSTL